MRAWAAEEGLFHRNILSADLKRNETSSQPMTSVKHPNWHSHPLVSPVSPVLKWGRTRDMGEPCRKNLHLISPDRICICLYAAVCIFILLNFRRQVSGLSSSSLFSLARHSFLGPSPPTFLC